MEQHVFSSNFKYFASISDNGVLKVWDAETQELLFDYIPNLQTSSACTSLIWVTLSQNKRSNAPSQECIVLGTQKGSVSIFSLSTGKLEATLKGPGHSGAVTGMCFDGEHTVYSAGEDCKIIVWNLMSGAQTRSWDLGNERPTALALSLDKKKLITASRQIKLWNIKTSDCKQTFTGHASSVQFLKVVQYENGEYLISGSKQNRSLSVWNLAATNKKRDSLATFALEDVPHFVDATCQNSTLSLVAVCRNNIVYHFVEPMDGVCLSAKPFKFTCSVNVVAENKPANTPSKQLSTIPTVAATSLDLSNILLAYGNTNTLRFERVRLQKAKKSEVLIRKDPRKIYNKAGEAGGDHKRTLEPIVDASQVEYSMIQASRKSLKPNDIQIGQRLENLSLAKGDHTAPAANKTQLLIQGLHSNDKTILAEIFSINDNHSVRSTLQKLPPQYIGSLVNELTDLMQQKIDKIEMGVSWMKVLLQTHTSQLMALGADELMNRFGPCMGVIEHRINNLKNLNRIKGRLDLLLNQMEDQPNLDIIETPNDQMLVYQDESEESGADDDDDDESSEGDGDVEMAEKMNGVGESSEEEDDEDEDENMVTDDDSKDDDDDDDEEESD